MKSEKKFEESIGSINLSINNKLFVGFESGNIKICEWN